MNIRNILNWFLSPSFGYYNMAEYDRKNIATMICNEYTEPVKSINNNYKEIQIKNIDITKYTDYLKPVAEIYNILNKEQPKYIDHFVLHGSLADFKYVRGWSDLDTWVVIKDDILKNVDLLMTTQDLFFRLNKLLLQIDPIAHHGYIILLQSDLDYYSFLPIEVLQASRNLYGPNNIKININYNINWYDKINNIKNIFTDFQLTGIFKHHPYKGEYLTKDMVQQNEGMYQLKYLIGLVMSFPILYYSAINKPVYKAVSFDLFDKEFSNTKLIDIFSEIRMQWGNIEKHPYTPNNIPSWLKKKLPLDYIEQTIRLLDEIINKIRR